jgi:hypothetical protein
VNLSFVIAWSVLPLWDNGCLDMLSRRGRLKPLIPIILWWLEAFLDRWAIGPFVGKVWEIAYSYVHAVAERESQWNNGHFVTCMLLLGSIAFQDRTDTLSRLLFAENSFSARVGNLLQRRCSKRRREGGKLHFQDRSSTPRACI